MSRVSRSYLDPWIAPLVPPLYKVLPIPRRFPPEGIVLLGHLIAAAAAVGFALSPRHWVWGLVAAAGVAGNHLCDMVDGTHARETDQCRNGGELLDHFTDPLSFSYWMVGLGVAAASLSLAIVAVLCIYATAVLTNIRAKITGEFRLSRFGPTEFKALLVVWALAAAGLRATGAVEVSRATFVFLAVLAGVGVVSLLVNLARSVRAVNRSDAEPDTSGWEMRERP